MSGSSTLAEAFPPGEYIKDELAARGWTQEDLAQILGRPLQMVNELVNGKKSITTETAIGLGAAFGTSSEFWLRLRSQFDLFVALQQGDAGSAANRRARLRELLPVNDMIKRGWLPDTKDIDILETAVREFLGVESLDATEDLPAAARRGMTVPPSWTPAQRAWLYRVRNLAKTRTVPSDFDLDRLSARVVDLVHLSVSPDLMRTVPDELDQVGVRLVIEPPLPGSKIDGAALWLDDASPVVALSLRYDRIDHFWFTLLHELAHIVLGHARVSAPKIDDADISQAEAEEEAANDAAGSWMLPGLEESRLPTRLGEILLCADAATIHPGLIVGRLHYRAARGEKGIPYNRHRKTLIKVRHLFSPS